MLARASACYQARYGLVWRSSQTGVVEFDAGCTAAAARGVPSESKSKTQNLKSKFDEHTNHPNLITTQAPTPAMHFLLYIGLTRVFLAFFVSGLSLAALGELEHVRIPVKATGAASPIDAGEVKQPTPCPIRDKLNLFAPNVRLCGSVLFHLGPLLARGWVGFQRVWLSNRVCNKHPHIITSRNYMPPPRSTPSS